MPIKLNLISILSNKHRRRILKECTEVDIGLEPKEEKIDLGEKTRLGIFQHKLKLRSYSTLWEHIRILHEAGLIEIYDYTPEKHPKGISKFKVITPAITKAKLNKIKKEIGKRRGELKEMEKLVERANEKFEKLYKNPKTRKIFKGIK